VKCSFLLAQALEFELPENCLPDDNALRSEMLLEKISNYRHNWFIDLWLATPKLCEETGFSDSVAKYMNASNQRQLTESPQFLIRLKQATRLTLDYLSNAEYKSDLNAS
jgi:hypothetical protein